MNESELITGPETSPTTPTRNPAVQRCYLARKHSLECSQKKGLDSYNTQENASEAYRNAMPDLSGYENIRDFIACITHGMLSNVIDTIEGPKFLYAAQIAVGALRHEPKDQKHPAAPPPTPYPVVTNS
jgi:hypothetical protein